jgi:hypothetical protein
MARGVGWFVGGSILLGSVCLLAGCGGFMFAEREPWRQEAEVQCLNSGAVKEGAGIVRIEPIRGPGICGADFPLKVSMLGESAPLGYSGDLRPPAAIPEGAPMPRWPVARPADAPPLEPARPPRGDDPVSLDPPRLRDRSDAAPPNYDFRRPYGAPPPPPSPSRVYQAPLGPTSPRDDFSPEPYERRPLVDAPGPFRGPSVGIDRAPAREAPPLVPLGPARGPQSTAATPVAISPPATLACPMVSELERWIASAVQPAALHWFGTPVAEITQISAYSCRGMNGNPRASISEHAFGNALDISTFTLADGRKITVKGGWNGLPEEQGFLRDVQGAACEQFSTVLAPGSNVYHYDHIHVDLMRRLSGHRACNPRAVSGEEVAARAGTRYGARRGSAPFVTSAITPRPAPRSVRSDAGDWNRRGRLRSAAPGEDGDDD